MPGCIRVCQDVYKYIYTYIYILYIYIYVGLKNTNALQSASPAVFFNLVDSVTNPKLYGLGDMSVVLIGFLKICVQGAGPISFKNPDFIT